MYPLRHYIPINKLCTAISFQQKYTKPHIDHLKFQANLIAAPLKGQSPNGFQYLELTFEYIYRRWDDIKKEQEEALGDKVKN